LDGCFVLSISAQGGVVLGRQGDCFADEEAMIRNRGPHRGITLLPSDNHPAWRQAFLHLHGPDEPPPLRAFIGGEIGSRLVSCDPVEIGASAVKNVNGSDHRALLPGLSHQLYDPGQGEGTDIFMGVIPASRDTHPF